MIFLIVILVWAAHGMVWADGGCDTGQAREGYLEFEMT
jgi:hypothetical protein